jgi:hypothetical protein
MNQINIEPTRFESVRTGDVTYGVRVYDSYANAYDNLWESIPDDDLEVFALVRDSDNDQIVAMIDFLLEHQNGCYIGGEWYEWEQIKHLFE